jgi:hypothetical protein
MEQALPLDKMTIAEKLGAMESLWDDLCRRPDEVPSPAWHEGVLKSREQSTVANAANADGTSRFQDWDEAKNRIRKQVE